ncbi:hypothetical protein HMPREF0021_02586 [Acinetobacter baumannii 6013150]|nr:hypothetical protein HMPREF0021_02586 [Acinetobacter baumannii 6013150]
MPTILKFKSNKKGKIKKAAIKNKIKIKFLILISITYQPI